MPSMVTASAGVMASLPNQAKAAGRASAHTAAASTQTGNRLVATLASAASAPPLPPLPAPVPGSLPGAGAAAALAALAATRRPGWAGCQAPSLRRCSSGSGWGGARGVLLKGALPSSGRASVACSLQEVGEGACYSN